jgi:hypothetical protein
MPVPLIGQQGRKQHDKQGPQIVDQIGLDGRGHAHGGKIQGVIAENAGNAEGPDAQRLTQGAERMGAEWP